ncbi:hypothetical protein ACOMHN_023131 [Nucella lapillus]
MLCLNDGHSREMVQGQKAQQCCRKSSWHVSDTYVAVSTCTGCWCQPGASLYRAVLPWPLYPPVAPVPTSGPCTHQWPLYPPVTPVPTSGPCTHQWPLYPPVTPVTTSDPCTHQ